jgi:hypothetical protein
VFEVVVGSTFYLCGLRLRNMEFYDFIRVKVLPIGIVGLLVAILVSEIYGPIKGINIYFKCVFYYSIFVALIVFNQKRILNEFFLKTKIKKVPMNIKKYNIRLICYIYLFLFSVTNIKYIYDFAYYVMKKAKMIGLVVIKFIIDFVINIANSSSAKDDEIVNQAEKINEQANGSGSDIKIFYIISIIFLTFILIKFHKRIKSVIISRFIKIVDFIKMLFRIEIKSKRVIKVDYIDEVEKIEKDKTKDKKIDKQIEESYRNIKKIKDPTKKVRAIYGWILNKYNVTYKMELSNSNTTGEIILKSQKILSDRSLSTNRDLFYFVTKIYEKVRYGGSIGETDLKEFEEKYDVLKRRLGK